MRMIFLFSHRLHRFSQIFCCCSNSLLPSKLCGCMLCRVRFVKFVFEKYSCSSAWKIICANLEWNLWENKINHQWEYVS